MLSRLEGPSHNPSSLPRKGLFSLGAFIAVLLAWTAPTGAQDLDFFNWEFADIPLGFDLVGQAEDPHEKQTPFTETPTPTSTFTATLTRTNSPTPTITNTSTPFLSPTQSSSPTVSGTPTSTPTVTDTATITQTPLNSPTASATPSPTSTATPSVTRTPTVTSTRTASPTPNQSLAEALDNFELEWVSPSLAWFYQSIRSHDGVDAAQSGAISNNQATVLSANLVGSGTLSFWWSVSSEPGFDVLSFKVDGQELDTVSGEADWELLVFQLPVGDHVAEWVYSKDRSRSQGSDAGWVDQVVWDPTVEPPLNPPRLLAMLARFQDEQTDFLELFRRSLTWQEE